MAQCFRTGLAVDVAQTVLVKEGASSLFIEQDFPPVLVALFHLADMQFTQRFDGRIWVLLVVAEGILVDADGPAMTAAILAAIADALEMLNEVRGIEESCHVAVR